MRTRPSRLSRPALLSLMLTLPALLAVSAPAAAAPVGAQAILPAATSSLVVPAAWPCPPGYHLGRGGQRCWPNGWAPAEEIPPGFVPAGPRVSPMPPVLECPPGYHLGRGLQRCWAN